MTRRLLTSLVAAFALACASAARQDIDQRPNIVFILADDLGARDLACTGSDFYVTPQLDALAEAGMTFTNAYANCANCAPTRAALMSGMYAPRTGVYTVGSAARGPNAERVLVPTPNTATLAPGVVTLAEALQAAGYATAHVGKWHLGDDETGPLSQGFDVNIAGNKRGHPKSYHSPYRNPDLKDGPDGEYLTDRLTDEAIDFVRVDRDEPFFLHLAYYTVHTPLQPRVDLLESTTARDPGELHNHARYAAMVEALDENVGRLLAELETLSIADNTLVVFTSDNGGMSPQTDIAPLRGSKGMVFEGGLRVPLIARWSGVIEPRSTCAEPVITLDFYPTLVDLAGAQLPPDQPVDGRNLAPLFKGTRTTLKRNALFWHFPCYLKGYAGMQEESHRTGWRATPCSVMRSGRWKLIRDYETGTDALYDLAADIGESHDVAKQQPSQRDTLAAQLDAWLTDVDAPIPTERNPDHAER